MPTASLAERIARRLRRNILRGELRPGAPIKERDGAAELGVSRTPMREAIRILANEGLVQLRPARSPIVAHPSLKEVTDAIRLLSALEILSGELACEEASAAQICEIETLKTRIEDCYEHMDPLDLFEIDMGFHSAIAAASNNAALVESHTTNLRRLWRVRYLSASMPESRQHVLRQHNAIVDGIKAHDQAATRDAIHAHLEALADKVRRRFEEEAASGIRPD